MAASEPTPNKPRKPETTTVNKLIGMCKPIAPPNTLTKNKNKMPIPSLIVVFPIKRIGLTGAPTINNKIINATMIVITTVELTLHQSFPCPLYSTYAIAHEKRTEKDIEPKINSCFFT